jgi:transcriptional regulator with XRE-family HTH domain
MRAVVTPANAQPPADAQPTLAAFGRRLKVRRVELGLTLDQAAEKTGLTAAQISHLENGQGDPRFSTIMRAVKGLDLTLQLHDVVKGPGGRAA